MGRIIDFPQPRKHAHPHTPMASSAGRPRADLSAVLLACLSVRRQIGEILEVTIAIEELIELQADPEARRELLERLWVSRREFVAAFKSISSTIAMLSRPSPSRVHHAATPPDGG